MKPIKDNFTALYLLPLTLWCLILGVVVTFYGYSGSFLLMNSWHTVWLDQPVFYLGWLGDSLLLGSLLVMLHRRKPGEALGFILILVVTGLLAQLLKQVVFPNWDRPLKVIGDDRLVHIVNNVRLLQNSFPSGHSVSAGAGFTLLAWYHKEKFAIILLSLFMVILVPFTRVYTGAHFPGDVLAGMILGSLVTIALFPLLGKLNVKVMAIEEKSRARLIGLLTILSGAGLIAFVLLQIFEA